MEDDLNSIGKQKMTSTLRQIEDDLNFLGKWKTTSKLLANGRQPQILRQMEDDFNI